MTNPILERMAAHRTVRAFTEAPVPDADVHAAVSAARMASTSSNVQGYSLLRVRDPVTRTKLEELTGGQSQVRRAGAFFCVAADQHRHRIAAELHGRPYAANLETFLVDVVDAALFAQNLALAFESQGYGICYIGGLRTRLPEVDALLEIPPDVFPLFGLCVGVPAADPGQRPRFAVEALLSEERFATPDEVRDQVRAYDETLGAYYEARGKPGWNWSDGTSRKLSQRHREHLHAYYREKGALLD